MSKLYCKFIDGKFSPADKLPPTATSITDYGETINPSALPDDILAKHFGYYPYKPSTDYDPDIYFLGGAMFNKERDTVVREIVPLTINVTEERNMMILNLTKKVFDRLSETDWYFIRKFEAGKEVPEDIINLRNKIRSNNDLLESKINSLRNPMDTLKFKKIFFEKLKNI